MSCRSTKVQNSTSVISFKCFWFPNVDTASDFKRAVVQVALLFITSDLELGSRTSLIALDIIQNSCPCGRCFKEKSWGGGVLRIFKKKRRIFKKQPNVSTLIAFSKGHFRSRGGGGGRGGVQSLKYWNVQLRITANDPLTGNGVLYLCAPAVRSRHQYTNGHVCEMTASVLLIVEVRTQARD